MHRVIIAFLPFFLVSCSSLMREHYEFKLTKSEIHPGFVKKMTYKLPARSKKVKLHCNNKRAGIAIDGDLLKSFISLNYKSEKKALLCELSFKRGFHSYRGEIFQFKVTPYKYPTSYIKVDKKHVDLSSKDLARWQREMKEVKAAYEKQIYDYPLFKGPFMKPLKSKVTAAFGSKRVFNNKKDAWHSGVDLRARRPTPIPVANDGKVIYTNHLFFNGKAVFVDHGMGIITMYCHLSQIKVAAGDMVKKGDIIGISGNTGRSSAPHLHWGTRVNGNWVSGLKLIQEGI